MSLLLDLMQQFQILCQKHYVYYLVENYHSDHSRYYLADIVYSFFKRAIIPFF